MLDNKKYLFVGMRTYCLNKMLDLNLNIVSIVTKKDSYVEKEMNKRGISCTLINNKQELLDLIRNTEFDVLVSNGCQYILPISDLRKKDEKYVNIHPSLLPDLRGINPINGAILFDRPQGATCHYMDDGIDTGDVIAQVKVDDNVKDIPLDLLYQLSFMAEADAFEKAYMNEFKPLENQNKNLEGTIYYSRKIEDQIINKDDSLKTIITKIKAFKVDGQYARFIKNDKEYLITDFEIVDPEILRNKEFENNKIVLVYSDNILVKIENKYVLLRLQTSEGLKVNDELLV